MIATVTDPSPVEQVAEYERGAAASCPSIAADPPVKVAILGSAAEAHDFIETMCFPIVKPEFRNCFTMEADTVPEGWWWVLVQGASEGVLQRIRDRHSGWTNGRAYECEHT